MNGENEQQFDSEESVEAEIMPPGFQPGDDVPERFSEKVGRWFCTGCGIILLAAGLLSVGFIVRIGAVSAVRMAIRPTVPATMYELSQKGGDDIAVAFAMNANEKLSRAESESYAAMDNAYQKLLEQLPRP